MKYDQLTVKDAIKVLAISGVILSSLALPALPIAYSALSKEWKKYRRGDIGRVVKRLYKQRLVKISEKDGKVVLELSNNGKKKLLSYDFDSLSLKRHYDGKLRVVIFDIPEKKKLLREVFRQKLKELGFKRIQNSVFLSPYKCKDEIEYITHFIEIAQYVIMFEVNKIELGDEFKFIRGTK